MLGILIISTLSRTPVDVCVQQVVNSSSVFSLDLFPFTGKLSKDACLAFFLLTSSRMGCIFSPSDGCREENAVVKNQYESDEVPDVVCVICAAGY